ncbi:hypothetical protein J2X46_000612 [Nocardioides sp. BE266]|uniref:hypothetical protein n=1 Tax=Nocardioides sp. BE266 TaxID=2817725 RepID=UPI0028634D17|nr:hypothetical protein [Nocardioides sp. BE266]MDR7251640.1 hypothetical protein [Nocardioides sp. BE266]
MTRRGYVAVALAALVLLVVPLGLAPFVAGVEEPAPAQDRAPRTIAGDQAVAASMACTDPADPAREVPTDVVAARLCPTENGLVRWYAPQDGLHADLAPLLELLVTLDPMPESTPEGRYICPQDGGWGFDLRLALASGETVSISGDTGGCSTVRIGGEDVVGSDEVLATFLSGITDQRAASKPASDLASLPLGCGSDTTFKDHVLSRIGDPRELVRAVSCWRPDSKDDVAPWIGPTPVPDHWVAVLADDMRRHSRADLGWNGADPCVGEPWTSHDLVGQTRWGDVVAIRGVCDTYLLSDVNTGAPEDQEFWYPSQRAQRILDRLRR